MKILIAPDSFKGSLTALEAALAMEKGIKQVFPNAETDSIPMADGGEGTVHALIAATKGCLYRKAVSGPTGEPVSAVWGMLGNRNTAVIEMAAASGLTLVRHDACNPMITTTFGTGQLILEALDHLHGPLPLWRPSATPAPEHAPCIVIGIGGSATNDGGTGAFAALGAQFLDAAGFPLAPGGGALSWLDRICLDRLDPRLAATSIIVACDVDIPLCGKRGAAAVFGPQKGASPEMVLELDAALWHYATVAEKATGLDVRNYSGAGAAGGLGAGLMLFAKARLMPGVELVLEVTDFEKRVQEADLVLTGEGQTDFQTAFGKAPAGVARAAKNYHKPVVCISGSLGKDAHTIFDFHVDALTSAVCACTSLKDCLADAAMLLEQATERAGRLIKVGVNLYEKMQMATAQDPATTQDPESKRQCN